MGFGLLPEERAGSGRLDGKRILGPAQLEHRRGNPVSAALRGSTARPSRAAPALYCWGGEGQTGARGVGQSERCGCAFNRNKNSQPTGTAGRRVRLGGTPPAPGELSPLLPC